MAKTKIKKFLYFYDVVDALTEEILFSVNADRDEGRVTNSWIKKGIPGCRVILRKYKLMDKG